MLQMDYSSDSDEGYEQHDLLTGQEKPVEVIERHPRRWACLCVTFFVGAVVAFSVYDWRVLLGHHAVPACRKTILYPFKVGCPTAKACASLRPHDTPRNARFFRTSVAWSFGALNGLHQHAAVANLSDARLRARVHAAPRFVRGFVDLEDELEREMPSGLVTKLQKELHVTMSYFCCLTSDEMKLLRKITQKWIDQQVGLAIPVHFNHVECSRERVNSVTTTLVADKKAQESLMSLNNHLQDTLMAADVPIVVTRMHQMPFHATIVGFQTRDSKSIGGFLERIAEAVFKTGHQVSLKTVISGKPKLGTVDELNNDKYTP